MIIFDLVLATRRPELTGLERYGVNLFRAMRDLHPDTVAFVAEAAPVEGPNVISVPSAEAVRRWLALPRDAASAARGRPHTVVFPSYPASPLFLLSRQRMLRIIHDDFPWTRTGEMSLRGQVFFRHFEAAMMPRYDVLAAPMPLVADELARRFRRPVAACGNAPGIDLSAVAPREIESLRGRRFVLLVGTVEPRKNYDALLAVAASAGEGAPIFVLAGRRGWGDIVARCEQAAATRGNLLWLDHAGDAELAWLYRNCAAFLTLSHGEGFNMPLVEAGIAGCGIVCSDLPIHRVVAPPGAMFVPPGSEPPQILRSLEIVEQQPRADPALYRQRFGWPEVARNVAALAAAPTGT